MSNVVLIYCLYCFQYCDRYQYKLDRAYCAEYAVELCQEYEDE